MQSNRMRHYWFASCILVLFSAAGCFQPAGGGLEATSIAQSLPTYTSIPSETPPPSATIEFIPTDTLIPSETPFQLVVVTNTPDPLLLGGTEVAAVPQAQIDDPVAGTATAFALQTQQGQPVLQPLQDATLDPLMLRATQIVSEATQTAAAPATQTAQAISGVVSTPIIAPTVAGSVPVATAVPSGSCVHTVVAGQNLFRISLQYNTTVDALAAANGILNPAMIIAGQTLTIPNCGTGTVVTTDGTSQSSSSGVVHTVLQGETLFEISLQYGVMVNDIAVRNNISNINLILIGQQIVIP